VGHRARALPLAALLAVVVGLAFAPPASADPFTYRDPGCTQIEDPVDLRFLDVRIAVPSAHGAPPTILTGAAAARWVVDRLVFQQPLGAGSSDSWFRFPDGACVDQTAWVTAPPTPSSSACPASPASATTTWTTS